MLLGLLLFIGVLGWPGAAQAQILDDTTRVLYGARTTRIIREEDVLRDQTEGRIIDTTLTNFPTARNWYHDSTFFQDLGHVGTAARPLLWRPNTELGARFGRHVFDRYARNPASIPYYDTKSPYTFFRFIQGGNGEQVFELSYARSINKNASIGVAYERFAANKIYTANPREGLVEHTNLLFFARFQSTDERYHALFNYTNVRHRSVEPGGIQPQTATTLPRARRDTILAQLFDYNDERPRLLYAANTEHRDGLRFVQTYRLLNRGLTAFHIVDWRRQMNKFLDTRLPVDAATNRLRFYPATPLLSTTATDDRAEVQQVENTVGVLGRTDLVEYRLYARQRNLSLTTRNLVGNPGVLQEALPQRRFTLFNDPQVFVGGTAAFRYKIFAIETAGEYRFFNEYWVRGAAKVGPFRGELLSTSYSPTLTQQEFSGNHYKWDNNFDNTNVNQLTVGVDQTLGVHRLEASGAVVNITSLVYYNEQGVPAQLGGDNKNKQLLTLSARHRFNVGNFFFDNQGHATSGGDGEGLRIPALITNSKVYYQGYVFKRALFGQIGAEVYYQSTWRPYDYSPSTQQFYVQNHFTAGNFAVADVFLSGDIRTVGFFLKMSYVNQGLVRNGYFVTPYYTGLPRRLEFGLRWQFFD